jgi:hypothetical protein
MVKYASDVYLIYPGFIFRMRAVMGMWRADRPFQTNGASLTLFNEHDVCGALSSGRSFVILGLFLGVTDGLVLLDM